MTDSLYCLDSCSPATASFTDAGANRVVTAQEILSRYSAARPGTRWVSDRNTLSLLQRAIKRLSPSVTNQSLLILDNQDPQQHARWNVFRAYFHPLVFTDKDSHFLSPDELADVMTSEWPSDFVIGGDVDEVDQMVLLYRGTLELLPVPFDMFQPSGDAVPDFTRFSVVDCGQTLKFGDYEATVESVLYQSDSAYRKRAKKNRVAQDDTFGGAFKRLRLLRGLTQQSFVGVGEREIRRIEANTVDPEKIHSETRKVLERYFGVGFDEIWKY